jgi:hypothetical protein
MQAENREKAKSWDRCEKKMVEDRTTRISSLVYLEADLLEDK